METEFGLKSGLSTSSTTTFNRALPYPSSRVTETVVPVPKLGLISPTIDAWLIGGASLLTFALYWIFVDTNASIYRISWIAFYASAVVNWPHFMSSYQLLYGDYRKYIFKQKSFFWAAIIVPLLLIAILSASIKLAQPKVLSYLLQAMYLSVGWHYVKQIYGTCIVASVAQKRYFGKLERHVLYATLISVWAMAWISSNSAISKFESDGISYYTLGLPEWVQWASYGLVAILTVTTVGVFTFKYIKTGSRPALASVLSFLAIYCWYLPVLYHPGFFYLVPFFHSLQYLLFVISYKRNKAKAESSQLEGAASRLAFVKKFWGFAALAIGSGILAFSIIPDALDRSIPFPAAVFGPTLWLFSFNVFINIHHYFVDNVIWRGTNPELKAHLFRPSESAPARMVAAMAE